jgi:hypothetical protein
MTVEQSVQQRPDHAEAGQQVGGFVDEIEQPIAITTLHKDLLEVVKAGWRTLPDRWDRCEVRVQDEHVDRVSLALDKAVRRTVQLLAGQMRASIDVDIDSVKFGDKIAIQLTAPKGAQYRHEIADAAKSGALLVLPDYPNRYTQRARDPAPEPPVDDKTADLFEDGTPKPTADAATNGEHDPDADPETPDGDGNDPDAAEPRFE